MKKSVILFLLLTFSNSFLIATKNKDKSLKYKQIQEILRFPKHVYNLKKLKIQNIEITKKFYGDHENNYYLICKNKSQKNYDKAVFYVHGGGWFLGKPENHLKMAEFLVEQGFIVILTAYRHLNKVNGNEILEDIKKSYHVACFQLKTEYPHLKCMVIGGASAGGHLASLLALSTENSSIPITGFFSLSGALDLNTIKSNVIIKKLTRNYLDFDKLNPIDVLLKSQSSFPILCIHGTEDGLVPVCSTLNFTEKTQNTCHNVETFYFHANHIDITSAWYYNSLVNRGQKEILISWLLTITEK